jgi:diguanylate cyclase (GGDEF)-like protein
MRGYRGWFRGASAVVAAALLCSGALLSAAHAQDFAAELRALRPLLGSTPERARPRLAELRRAADEQGRIDARLSIDEVDCRLLTDVDAEAARRVAEAGVAKVPQPVPEALMLPLLRLQACLAGMLVEQADAARGAAELDRIIAAAAPAALQSARALALLERGVFRSRGGRYVEGQQDLLEACELLRAPGLDAELDLCLSHLANHFKRVGDFDEAMNLLTPLVQRAQAVQARFDESIYELGIGQIHAEQHNWAAALEHFERSLRQSRALGSASGVTYAQHGAAAALLNLERQAEALRCIDEALSLIGTAFEDRSQALRSQVVRARILARLGRGAEARAQLEPMEAQVRAAVNEPLLADFLRAGADAAQAQQRWREAYQLHQELDAVQERLAEQRNSQRSALLRAQFNRARDARELQALKQAQHDAETLRLTQGLATVLALILLALTAAYAWRKVAQSRTLHALALVDELTGLSNRRAILGVGAAAFDEAARAHSGLAVLMIDLDHFKRINDERGHAVGDAVLQAAGRCIAHALRERDRVGRVGGEEFLAVLPGADAAQAFGVAERVRRAIAETEFQAQANSLRCSVSIGVASRLDSDTRLDAVIARADQSLYAAKAAGRDRVMANAAPQRAPVDAR